MQASALTENNFQHSDMTDIDAEEHGSTIDSDVDSAAEETTSRGSRSSEPYALSSDVSLLALLSSKSSTLTDDKCRRNECPTVLDTPPSTSTAITNYECNVDYATAPSEGQHNTSQKEPFIDEARAFGFAERNTESVSPWMRNAGRKKSHPVWDFFKDLRTPDGTGGVICLHCNWKGDDRSPNNLKTHLKRFHDHDGVYKQFAANFPDWSVQMTTSSPPTPEALSSGSNRSSPASSQSHMVQSMSNPSLSTHHGLTSMQHMSNQGSMSAQHGLAPSASASSVISGGLGLDSRLMPPSMCSLVSTKVEDCMMRNSGGRLNEMGAGSGGTHNMMLANAMMAGAAGSTPQEVLAQVITPPAGMTTMNGHHQKQCDMRRSRRPFKQSTVWDHFLKLSDGNVQCVHCAKILKRKDSSTKTMWGHLRAIHYKGRDWTALQQQAQSGNPVNDPFANMDESMLADTSIGSTQSWLEEQLGISSSPSHDENQLDTRGGAGESSCNAEFSDLEPQDAGGVKRLNDEGGANDGTPTQPYVKRNRPTGYSPIGPTSNELYMNSTKLPPTNGLTAVRAALSQQQKNTDDKKTMNFLAMIPRSSEVINITAGFSGEEDGTANSVECNSTIDENGEECASESAARSGGAAVGTDGSASASGPSNNQINAAALLSAAANNPFMYMAAANAIAATGMNAGEKLSTFSLMDGECVVTLMRVAAELDCTFLFHCRDGQAHFCFEANETAAEKLRGAELSLVDIGNEVRVTEWNAGVEMESEMWKKTDWTQFTWAIRGKCQKVLLKR